MLILILEKGPLRFSAQYSITPVFHYSKYLQANEELLNVLKPEPVWFRPVRIGYSDLQFKKPARGITDEGKG